MEDVKDQEIHTRGGIGLSLDLCLDHAPDRPPPVAVEGRQDTGMVVTTPGPILAHFLGHPPVDPTTARLPGQDRVLTPALLLQQRTKLTPSIQTDVQCS